LQHHAASTNRECLTSEAYASVFVNHLPAYFTALLY
jgi:hypothetical protein